MCGIQDLKCCVITTTFDRWHMFYVSCRNVVFVLSSTFRHIMWNKKHIAWAGIWPWSMGAKEKASFIAYIYQDASVHIRSHEWTLGHISFHERVSVHINFIAIARHLTWSLTLLAIARHVTRRNCSSKVICALNDFYKQKSLRERSISLCNPEKKSECMIYTKADN